LMLEPIELAGDLPMATGSHLSMFRAPFRQSLVSQ
jgi:hypothetical protein